MSEETLDISEVKKRLQINFNVKYETFLTEFTPVDGKFKKLYVQRNLTDEDSFYLLALESLLSINAILKGKPFRFETNFSAFEALVTSKRANNLTQAIYYETNFRSKSNYSPNYDKLQKAYLSYINLNTLDNSSDSLFANVSDGTLRILSNSEWDLLEDLTDVDQSNIGNIVFTNNTQTITADKTFTSNVNILGKANIGKYDNVENYLDYFSSVEVAIDEDLVELKKGFYKLNDNVNNNYKELSERIKSEANFSENTYVKGIYEQRFNNQKDNLLVINDCHIDNNSKNYQMYVNKNDILDLFESGDNIKLEKQQDSNGNKTLKISSEVPFASNEEITEIKDKLNELSKKLSEVSDDVATLNKTEWTVDTQTWFLSKTYEWNNVNEDKKIFFCSSTDWESDFDGSKYSGFSILVKAMDEFGGKDVAIETYCLPEDISPDVDDKIFTIYTSKITGNLILTSSKDDKALLLVNFSGDCSNSCPSIPFSSSNISQMQYNFKDNSELKKFINNFLTDGFVPNSGQFSIISLASKSGYLPKTLNSNEMQHYYLGYSVELEKDTNNYFYYVNNIKIIGSQGNENMNYFDKCAYMHLTFDVKVEQELTLKKVVE